jgi:hypothetical protein
MMMLSLCIHGFPPCLARLSLGGVLDTTTIWAFAHSQVTALLYLKEVPHFPRSAENGDDPLGYRGTQAVFLLVFSRSGETLADAARHCVHAPQRRGQRRRIS